MSGDADDGHGLVIVARAPGAESKTRLADSIGAEACLGLQRAFLSDVVAWATGLVREPVLSVHPPERAPELAAAHPAARVVAQLGEGFGTRMRGAVNAGFAGDRSAVAMVATDSPTLPAELVVSAWSALERADAVLAPAEDGGWVLIATRRPLPESCFTGVRWSSAHACEDTRTALERSGLSVELGAPWYDVDSGDDLKRLGDDLVGDGRARAPATARALDELGL